jgi:hypothetical protein
MLLAINRNRAMDTTTLPATTYSYAQAEAALARCFGVEPVAMPRLRGRIDYLRKNGLRDRKPGKGTMVHYTEPSISKWLIALVLESAGQSPQAVAQFVSTTWTRRSGHTLPNPSLAELWAHARVSDSDVLAMIRVNHFGAEMATDIPYQLSWQPLVTTGLDVGLEYEFQTRLGWESAVTLVFNLSAWQRGLDAALAAVGA